MLKEWLKKVQEEKVDEEEALCELRDLVVAAADDEVPGLLAALTEDPFSALLEVPLVLHEATGAVKEVIDRLRPDPEQAEILARRLPISWGMSVWGGNPFDVRVLLNGVVLVRNHHRVLGPSFWQGETLEASPGLIRDLTEDVATLRSRNEEDAPCCFLLTRTEDGVRLLGEGEEVDLFAPSWGQTIAVCDLGYEDLEDGSPLRSEALRRVGSAARSLIVFLRFFEDRVDLIPAERFDDDLDVFLEELAEGELSEYIVEGMDLPPPSTRDELVREVLCRMEYETYHLRTDGAGADWMRDLALPALARRLTDTMSWSTPNFGFGPDPDGPRRPVPLPAGVEEVLATDPDLKRRSVTLQVMSARSGTRDLILNGGLIPLLSEAIEGQTGEEAEIVVTGRVDLDVIGEVSSDLADPETLSDRFGHTLDTINEAAEAQGEDPDEAALEAGLGVVLLIDFPSGRPSDRNLAATARAISGELAESVRLHLIGRGEYLAYAEGEADSGDHELFRLDEDEDDEGD
jgi:hypothetical protein